MERGLRHFSLPFCICLSNSSLVRPQFLGSCGATVFKDEHGRWGRCPQCKSADRKTWGQLKLSNAGRQVTDLLQFTKLHTVFEVHPSEADALKSFTA